MKLIVNCIGLCASVLVAACATSPDHFYNLNTLPDAERGPLATPPVHVLLDVTIPALVDRAEMVMSTSRNAILVLDHERWATGFSDQVVQTLARDIETRRPDILIGDRGFDQANSPPVMMKVDIVKMSAQRGGRASIEAHWRIVDAGAKMDQIGNAAFEVPLGGEGYASVAQAYSQALSSLAEKLAGTIGRR
ncbi:MAG: hypothetical protein JWN43_356 [Gammaproteobacteria bacterium]|nr:hypothetical protein [Gammaproteobacteria bacterium]